MDTNELAHVIEAILFVAGEPVNLKDLQQALEVTEDETRLAIDALDSDYSYHRRGITLKRFGEHVQLSPSRSRAFPSPPWKPSPSWPTASPSPSWKWRRCAGSSAITPCNPW